MINYDEIGLFLLEERKRLELTQKQLADRLNIKGKV
mgnify:CR=1 FL=1